MAGTMTKLQMAREIDSLTEQAKWLCIGKPAADMLGGLTWRDRVIHLLGAIQTYQMASKMETFGLSAEYLDKFIEDSEAWGESLRAITESRAAADLAWWEVS